MRKIRIQNEKMASILLLLFILIGMSKPVIAQGSIYSIAIPKGTQTYEVQPYDEEKWAKTVTDWFKGDCNKSGAKSKVTTRAIYTNWTWGMYDVFLQQFLPMIYGIESSYALAALVGSLDYDKEYINETYDEEFAIWNVYQAKWFFTKDTFNETANYTWYSTPIFKDPADHAKALEAYNDLITDINREPLIKFLNLIFPRFTPDEYLWNLVLNGLIIPQPANLYLSNLVEALRCSANVRVEDNTLIFRRLGKDILLIEVTFGKRGTQETFTVKNVYGSVIYQITSTHSHDIALNIALLFGIPLIGVIFIYIMYRMRKKKKEPRLKSSSILELKE